ncbi:ATP-binding protein [Streptomyces sp. H27-S2]|uniref:ATP-binding protein n=1 Tax=Streptomyces antarcticus TaxID=2996458 RepID=UPI002270D861|nr:ATP-binding protein [Streptomyces sp. H27-S2]MCY0953183.1 ATP-binding protein [Streptomyces sp. H27-S2]
MSTPTAADATGSDRHCDGGRPVVATSAAARRRVSECLEHVGISLDSVIAADALMVTTELVTNAIRHGGGILHFHTDIAGDALHVSVGDASTRTPSSRRGDPGQPGGYGWPLIQRLAEHIDITLHPEGKTIRAVLRLT